jgi:hypothetical protein
MRPRGYSQEGLLAFRSAIWATLIELARYLSLKTRGLLGSFRKWLSFLISKAELFRAAPVPLLARMQMPQIFPSLQTKRLKKSSCIVARYIIGNNCRSLPANLNVA